MQGIRMGTWMVHSDTDPRWNKTGRGMGLIGGPEAMQKWIIECRGKYGDPPEDVTQEFWKD